MSVNFDNPPVKIKELSDIKKEIALIQEGRKECTHWATHGVTGAKVHLCLLCDVKVKNPSYDEEVVFLKQLAKEKRKKK